MTQPNNVTNQKNSYWVIRLVFLLIIASLFGTLYYVSKRPDLKCVETATITCPKPDKSF